MIMTITLLMSMITLMMTMTRHDSDDDDADWPWFWLLIMQDDQKRSAMHADFDKDPHEAKLSNDYWRSWMPDDVWTAVFMTMMMTWCTMIIAIINVIFVQHGMRIGDKVVVMHQQFVWASNIVFMAWHYDLIIDVPRIVKLPRVNIVEKLISWSNKVNEQIWTCMDNTYIKFLIFPCQCSRKSLIPSAMIWSQ